jgi:hypothetical protein
VATDPAQIRPRSHARACARFHQTCGRADKHRLPLVATYVGAVAEQRIALKGALVGNVNIIMASDTVLYEDVEDGQHLFWLKYESRVPQPNLEADIKLSVEFVLRNVGTYKHAQYCPCLRKWAMLLLARCESSLKSSTLKREVHTRIDSSRYEWFPLRLGGGRSVRLVPPARVRRLLAEGAVRARLGDVLRAQEDDGVARTSASVFPWQRLPLRSAVLAWSLGYDLQVTGHVCVSKLDVVRTVGCFVRERLTQKADKKRGVVTHASGDRPV